MKLTSAVSSILLLALSLQAAIAAPVKVKPEPVTTIALPEPILPAPVHGKIPLDPDSAQVFSIPSQEFIYPMAIVTEKLKAEIRTSEFKYF
ncbi:hypothetical protein BDQ17DRAFT_1433022 [Cyathus striatus]|nr:hypothetical protein BDQ17DRAFT_1433022 [Cyathus striatus]